MQSLKKVVRADFSTLSIRPFDEDERLIEYETMPAMMVFQPRKIQHDIRKSCRHLDISFSAHTHQLPTGITWVIEMLKDM
jgi:hypothetical protein